MSDGKSEFSETEMRPAGSIKSSDSQPRVTDGRVAEQLAQYGLESYLDEIINNVYDPKFKEMYESRKPLNGWTSDQVIEWIKTLNFLSPHHEHIGRVFQEECINGVALESLNEKQWVEKLGLGFVQFLLIRLILDGWKYHLHRPIVCPPGVPQTVAAGVVADLSHCTYEEAKALDDADRECSDSGAGYIYGQLVALGYREYRIQGNGWQPVGMNNEKYVLKRRKIPNGIKQVLDTGNNDRQRTSHTISIALNFGEIDTDDMPIPASDLKITFEYVPDPSKDLFQAGRMAEPLNDFSIKGPLHWDSTGIPCGPVSRFACRIECERLPPFRSFIYAAGFNDKKDIFLNASAPKWYDKEVPPEERWKSFDGLTTYGVKLWRPDLREWCEVSVQGNTFRTRTKIDEVGERLEAPFSNELVDGCIIDLCGAVMVFQSPATMAAQLKRNVDPMKVIERLNDLKPQCPVNMSTITFSYLTAQDRAMRAIRRLETSGASYTYLGPVHIPTTDYEDIEEEKRSYVFPACGHVHGYHKSLQGRPCPLCRKKGDFVPIAFAFEPAICSSARPTHVFNPCGHVASRLTCVLWAGIPMYDSSPITEKLRPLCPFCATVLHEKEEGGPFNKLILQTEGREAWETDDEDEREVLGIGKDKDKDSERSNSSNASIASTTNINSSSKSTGSTGKSPHPPTQASVSSPSSSGDKAASSCSSSSPSTSTGTGIAFRRSSHPRSESKDSSTSPSSSPTTAGRGFTRGTTFRACSRPDADSPHEILYRRELERLQSELDESCMFRSFENAMRMALQGIVPRFPKYAPQLTPAEPLESVVESVSAAVDATKIRNLASGNSSYQRKYGGTAAAKVVEEATAAAIANGESVANDGKATVFSREFLNKLNAANSMDEAKAGGGGGRGEEYK